MGASLDNNLGNGLLVPLVIVLGAAFPNQALMITTCTRRRHRPRGTIASHLHGGP